MTIRIQHAIERLRALISIAKKPNISDFLSGKHDIISMLEDQTIKVATLAKEEQLTKQETALIKRLILEAQFLII